MKKLELIQLEEIDANFIIVYEGDIIEYTNYFMGINGDTVDNIARFTDYKDQRFNDIFQSFFHPFGLEIEAALKRAWDLHCKLFIKMEESIFSIPRLNKNSTKKDIIWYLNWLSESEYAYHIDEDVEDIIWNKNITKHNLSILKENAEILWKTSEVLNFTPWQYYTIK